MTLSREKLAVIHIVAKELALSEEEYRGVLKKVAGVSSAKDLSESGFRKLMNELVRDKRYRILPGGMTLKQKLLITHLTRELGWDDEHLRNFIHKYYHLDSLEGLNRKKASKLIESLKHIKVNESNSLS